MSIFYADDQPVAEWPDQNTNQTSYPSYILDQDPSVFNAIEAEITKLNRRIEMLTIQSNMQRQNEALMNIMYQHKVNAAPKPAGSLFEAFKKVSNDKDPNSEEITITLKKCSTIRESVNQLMDILKQILPKITPDNVDKWTLHISLDPHKIKEKKKK